MIIKKTDFEKFMESLKRYDVYAPLGNKFEKLGNPEEITLDRKTSFSAREIFFPNREELLKFDGSRTEEIKPKIKKTILFGVRPCDMNAIKHLDLVLKDDPYYNERRKNTIILGVQCVKHFPNCFCHLTGTFETDNYDMLFIESDNNFFIQIGSKQGETLVKNFKPKAKKVGANEVETLLTLIKQDFIMESRKYNIFINEEKIKEFAGCLSCNMCNAVCPTCACYLLRDRMNIDLKSGIRYREWDSCQLERYTKIAEGVVFRKERLQRVHNWIFCKFDYSKKNHGMYGCVGCGRCVSVCPVKINIFDAIEVK